MRNLLSIAGSSGRLAPHLPVSSPMPEVLAVATTSTPVQSMTLPPAVMNPVKQGVQPENNAGLSGVNLVKQKYALDCVVPLDVRRNVRGLGYSSGAPHR